MTLGLKRAGFDVVAAVEIDKLACETYRENHPEVRLWEIDIRELAAADEILLEPLRNVVQRSAIASLRGTPILAGVLGERAEVLGAVALVLRESRRYVAEPPAGQPAM